MTSVYIPLNNKYNGLITEQKCTKSHREKYNRNHSYAFNFLFTKITTECDFPSFPFLKDSTLSKNHNKL